MQNPPDDRYSRQTRFAPIGSVGQQKLLNSYAVIIGCGGLGTNLAQNLVRAGVGHITLIDRDCVELSNLQRQMLFDEGDVGDPKALVAERKLRPVNSDTRVEGRVENVTAGNIEELILGASVVLDGVDNLDTRFLLNEACIKHGIPWVHGACVAGRGLVMPIIPDRTPCLRCVFDDDPSLGEALTSEQLGILASTVSVTASYQAVEALKILIGCFDPIPRLFSFDLWEETHRSIPLASFDHAGQCPVCGKRRFKLLDQAGK